MSTALEAQYKALTGEDPDKRWSPETLRKKVDEAKAEDAALNSDEEDVAGPSEEAKSGAPMSDDGKRLATEETPKAVKSGVKLDEHTMLVAKALELLIEVDEDWDDNRLRAEIQQAREGRADLQVKGAVPPAEMGDVNYDKATKADKEPEIPVTLEADYWAEEDKRTPAGTELNLPKSKATQLINEGKARRNDPLPG